MVNGCWPTVSHITRSLPSSAVTTHFHTQLMYSSVWRILEKQWSIAASSEARGHCHEKQLSKLCYPLQNELTDVSLLIAAHYTWNETRSDLCGKARIAHLWSSIGLLKEDMHVFQCEAVFNIVQLFQKQAKFLKNIVLYTALQTEQVIKHSSGMFL